MDNLIYKFINQSVRDVDTYQHNGSTWLIFTNDKKWVIELTKDKTLWYNYSFFKSIFDFFSMDVVENQHYITKWVEDVIKNGTKQTVTANNHIFDRVEDTIENGVKETNGTLRRTLLGVDDIIQNGVKETKTPGNGDIMSTVEWMKENNSNSYPKMIDEVLENGVKQIEPLPAQDGNRDWGNYYHGKEDRTKPFNEYVDDVINNGVKEVYWLPNEHKLPVNGISPIDDVIDNGIKETHDDVYHHKGRIDGVIKCGEKTSGTFVGGKRQMENIDSVIGYGIRDTKAMDEWVNTENIITKVIKNGGI